MDRGEYPKISGDVAGDGSDGDAGVDVAALAQVVPLMCLARAVTQQPISREFSLRLIDGVLIPALRGAG